MYNEKQQQRFPVPSSVMIKTSHYRGGHERPSNQRIRNTDNNNNNNNNNNCHNKFIQHLLKSDLRAEYKNMTKIHFVNIAKTK